MNQYFIMAFIYFLSQEVNVNINNVGSEIKADIPYLFSNVVSGQYPSAISHEILEQGKLFGRQFNIRISPAGNLFIKIKF